MAEYIERDAVIALIEEKQKELCPVGRYSRNYVYGSDRERFDSWQDIINQIDNITAAEIYPVSQAVNVIQSFYLCNDGDEATIDLILAIGAELLNISTDRVLEMVAEQN